MVHPLGMLTQPAVGFCSPAMILSIVLLPAPFLPTRQTRSLAFTTKLTSLKSGFTPNSTARLFTEINVVSVLVCKSTEILWKSATKYCKNLFVLFLGRGKIHERPSWVRLLRGKKTALLTEVTIKQPHLSYPTIRLLLLEH